MAFGMSDTVQVDREQNSFFDMLNLHSFYNTADNIQDGLHYFRENVCLDHPEFSSLHEEDKCAGEGNFVRNRENGLAILSRRGSAGSTSRVDDGDEEDNDGAEDDVPAPHERASETATA